MRRTAAIITAAAVLATLAACSTTDATPTGCDFAPGDASSAIEATGALGSTPTVTFPTPLVGDGIQRSEIVSPTDADAEQIATGAQVDVDYAIYNGATGEVLGTAGYDDETLQLVAAGTDTNFLTRALGCSEVGARYAVTGTLEETLGATAAANTGLDLDLPIVIVFDVLDAFLGKADGANQLPQDGMPYVATAVDGTPGITLPDAAAPTELRISTLKAGSHGEVGVGDTVVVKYSGWIWGADGTPSSFDSSWSSGSATSFTLEDGALISGFLTALDGAQIGDQILAVIPPDEGYGDTPPSGSTIPAGATLVFVIDVLGVVD